MNQDTNGVNITSVIGNQLIFSNAADNKPLISLTKEDFTADDPFILTLQEGIRCNSIEEIWHVSNDEAPFNYVAKSHDDNGNLVIGIFRNDLFLGRVQMKYDYFDRSYLPYNKPETNLQFTSDHPEYNSSFYRYAAFETLLNENIADYDADLTYEYLLLMVIRDARDSSSTAETKMISISNPPEDMKIRIARIIKNIVADNPEKVYVFNQTLMGKLATTYLIDPKKF